MKFSHLAVLAAILPSSEAFVPTSTSYTNHAVWTSPNVVEGSSTALWATMPSDDDSERPTVSRLRNFVSKTKKSLAFVALASSALVTTPRTAQASAPVMAIPKAEARDPLKDALENHQRRMQAQAQKELADFGAQARQIEAAEGPDARAKFETEYKARKEQEAQDRLDRIKKLKYDLLDQGICPFTDMEGQRRLFEAEKGLDPAKVPGTQFYVEREYSEKKPQKSFAYIKQPNREMIKAIVQDMKNRGMDPLEYFEKHQERTNSILQLPAAQATALAARYQENLQLYGQISPPKEGEMSAKEMMALKEKSSSTTDKGEAKKQKAEAKAQAAAEKAALKQKMQEEKAKAKAEAQAAKEAAKKEKEAAKAAAAMASASQAVVAAEGAVSTVTESISNTPLESDVEVQVEESLSEELTEAVVETPAAVPVAKKSSKGLPIVPAAGVVIAVGGGGYALKLWRDKAAADEEERQRQFKLLMSGMESSSPVSSPALEEVDSDLADFSFEEERTKPIETTEQVAPKKKKRLGVKSVFGKKKSERETDINMLVSGDAKAPEFAKLLAKILTYGAPGRFPEVIGLPGGMPMEEFDQERACTMLTEAQEGADLSKEEAAEVFANVVNCMLIDIVDLASSSLKEKDGKMTVDAIGIVVDFMMHASSLYNAIAEGVVITPVTYGGDLPKGKLEQMFSAYAASGLSNMMSMDEDFENRVALLQDVFQINEKKGEGLVMKAVQKQMMDALKSGKGLEGMDEMMKGMNMDALTGMPGMGGDEDISPEQLKELLTQLKVMKDSGALPADEMKAVKEQFKDAFGSSMDEVIKEAEKEGNLGMQDKELLDLMKAVLYD